MAAVSHLPHVLANVLVAQAAARARRASGCRATGPSFRDATRVAGANPALWRDIYLANARRARWRAIDDTVARLGAVRAALAGGDARGARAPGTTARATSAGALLEADLAGGAGRASCASRSRTGPGVVAEIALALGRAGVNIVDMALTPSPDITQRRRSRCGSRERRRGARPRSWSRRSASRWRGA